MSTNALLQQHERLVDDFFLPVAFFEAGGAAFTLGDGGALGATRPARSPRTRNVQIRPGLGAA